MDITMVENESITELNHIIYQNSLSNYRENLEEIEKWMYLERYQQDIEFRLLVLVYRLEAYALDGRNDICVQLTKEISPLLIKIENSTIQSMVYFRIAYAYQSLHLETLSTKYYHKLIEWEKVNGITGLSVKAHNNLGNFYYTRDMFDQSLNHFQLAKRYLDVVHDEQLAESFQVFVDSNLSFVYSKLGQLKLAKLMLPMVGNDDISWHKDRLHSSVRFHAKMIYYGKTGKIKEMIQQFELGKKVCFQIDLLNEYIEFLLSFAKLCKENEVGYDLLGPYLEEANGIIPETYTYYYLIEFYEIYLDFLQVQQASEKEEMLCLERLSNQILAYQQLIQDEIQLNAIIYMQETNTKKNETTFGQMQMKNRVLQDWNKQLLMNQDKLNQKTKELMDIAEIGKEILSTIDLKEIAELFYHHISHRISLDIFAIFLHNAENGSLDSLLLYDKDKSLSALSLDLEQTKHVVVQTFHKQEIVALDFLSSENNEIKDVNAMKEQKVQMILSFPIQLEDHILGVLSVQSLRNNAFSVEDIAYIDNLLPFLAISINNAIISQQLNNIQQEAYYTKQELKQINQTLQNLSNRDGLTGLFNRRALELYSAKLMAKATMNKRSVTVMMIDVDDFKRYNDIYGHIKGDIALQKVANQLNNIFKAKDQFVCRYGGEEFLAIQIGLTSNQAREKAELIIHKIQSLAIEHEHSFYQILTVSIGYTYVKDTVYPFNQMVQKSDQALYQAKNNAKNQVQLWK